MAASFAPACRTLVRSRKNSSWLRMSGSGMAGGVRVRARDKEG
jgi:hypothetical protein